MCLHKENAARLHKHYVSTLQTHIISRQTQVASQNQQGDESFADFLQRWLDLHNYVNNPEVNSSIL